MIDFLPPLQDHHEYQITIRQRPTNPLNNGGGGSSLIFWVFVLLVFFYVIAGTDTSSDTRVAVPKTTRAHNQRSIGSETTNSTTK